jgi:hypothetical protein
MKTAIPAWAMRKAAEEDHALVQDAHRRGTLQIDWPNRKMLRDWSRLKGWPTPWFGFEAALLATLFESRSNFQCALDESGIAFHVPRREYILSLEQLRELDELYELQGPGGHRQLWGALVEELREIRRAVQAGVAVQVEGGPRLQSGEGFYKWAHGRYHMLEESADKWIGDDR